MIWAKAYRFETEPVLIDLFISLSLVTLKIEKLTTTSSVVSPWDAEPKIRKSTSNNFQSLKNTSWLFIGKLNISFGDKDTNSPKDSRSDEIIWCKYCLGGFSRFQTIGTIAIRTGSNIPLVISILNWAIEKVLK